MILFVLAAFIVTVSGEPGVIYSSSVSRYLSPDLGLGPDYSVIDDGPDCKDVVQLKPGPNGLQADVDIPFDGKKQQVVQVAVTGENVHSSVKPIQGAVLNELPMGDSLKARFYLPRTNTPDISSIKANGKVVCQDDFPKYRSGLAGSNHQFRFYL